MAGKGRQAQPGQEGSRPGRLQGTATGAGMGEKQIRTLLAAVEGDIEEAKAAGQWAAVNANRRIERQLHIDLAEAIRIRKAEAAARKAERVVTLEEAREMLIKALRGLPEADREAVIEEATGPARLALVEGE